MAENTAFLNQKIFANRIAVFIGLISYPLYLWHWPLICIARNNLGGELPTGSLMAGILVLSFVLAYLTYTLVERPMRSHKATWRLVLSCLLILALVTIGTKTLIRRSQTVENLLYSGLPVEVQETLKNLPRSEERDSICENKFGADHSVCRATTEKPSVLVFGDSHSHIMWNAMYQRDDLPSLYMVGSGGSIVFDGLINKNGAGAYEYEKAERTTRVWNVVRNSPEIKTIVLRGFWSSNFRSDLLSTKYPKLKGEALVKQHWVDLFTEMARLNKRLIIVLDNVDAPFNPLLKCISIQRVSLGIKNDQMCLLRYDEINQDQYKTREYLRNEATKWPNVKIVDAWEALCDENGCYLVRDKTPYYRDGNHLSVYGNKLVWELINRNLDGLQ